jgi:hydroxymethylcytosylglucuronate/cytosylglucuronate synthase
VLLGSDLGRPLLAEHEIDDYYDVSGADVQAVGRIVAEEQVDAAVVVLDPAMANACTAAGVPTVYVDSLPFLWTRGDLPGFPLDVSAYCAQSCLDLPEESRLVLDEVARLHWVDPIITTSGARTATRRRAGAGRRVLVSLGGLRSPRITDWAAYPRLVVPAVLGALRDAGRDEVHVAGNLPPTLAEEFIASGPASLKVTIGALEHRQFVDRLDECDVLLTSPGLTTLLEASSRGVPVVALPPQNMSQILNARFHRTAVGDRFAVSWPPGVFTDEEAIAATARGEAAALEIIYGGIARAQGTRIGPAMRQRIVDALRAVTAGGTEWGALARQLGTKGADQVAEIMLATANRPAGRPGSGSPYSA